MPSTTPMDRAVSEWLAHTSASPAMVTSFAKQLNKSYTVYGDMLLLPRTALAGHTWEALLDCGPDREALCTTICKHIRVTHIAINRPIPLACTGEKNETNIIGDGEFNLLRSPVDFTPLHGDFGPAVIAAPTPTQRDFQDAFWVTAKQNGIYQTWAPRWTMFSRGNVSEKARLLTLPSVTRAVEEGKESGLGCTVVDLFAGIGYFAFSYVKVGATKVLCWDLNAWSVEGLRRGAEKNRWLLKLGGEGDVGEEQLLVFHESNERAVERIRSLRHSLPPVRHINCGMLPSSSAALHAAAFALDSRFVGWVHLHENFLVEDIAPRAEVIRLEFEKIVTTIRGDEGTRVEVEHINRLKSYAPGVMHCVLDIVVFPALSR